MGVIRVLIGLYLGWWVVKTAGRFFAGMVTKSTAAEPKLDEQPVKTLELMACPSCGVYTTAPCTNPDCLKN